MKKVIFALVLAVLSSAVSSFAANERRRAVRHVPGKVVLTVDFAEQRGPVRLIASGFLSSVDPLKPPDNRITPLKPQIWRDYRFWVGPGQVNADLYHRLRNFAPRLKFDPSNNWFALHNFLPCRNWNSWSDFIRQSALDLKARNITDLQWDIWGEPDNGSFLGPGKCSVSDYFELYRRAFTEIRNVFLQASVGGPSPTNIDIGWSGTRNLIQGLLDFCLSNGCEVNYIDWHELVDTNVPDVSEHIKEIRQIVTLPKYAPLRINEIHVGEIVGGEGTYNPGHFVVMFAELDEGGADYALKACWPVPGPGDCDFNTLDGLLTPDSEGSEPRAGWWVYRAYAEQAGSRVNTSSNHPAFAALASMDASGRAQILAGSSSFAGASETSASLTLRGLSAGQRNLRIYRIPNRGNLPLLEREVIADRKITIDLSGVYSLEVASMKPDEAYQIVLDP